MKRYVVVILLFSSYLLLCSSDGAAEQGVAQSSQSPEFFDSPFLREISRKDYASLTKIGRWLLRTHGLRDIRLDPNMWVVRNIDRTDNRRMVPIRPFYLNASRDPSFRLRSIELSFEFDKVNPEAITNGPSQYSPVLGLWFGGEFLMGLPGERVRRDRHYALTLSASPLIRSGIRFRSHARSLMLDQAASPTLETGRKYNVLLSVTPDKATATLNGAEFSSVSGAELDRGLITLVGDWVPMHIHRLEIRGSTIKDGMRTDVTFSGLVRDES